MLEKAAINLKEYKKKLNFSICDNNEISLVNERADFVIEGWSFGHTVSDHSDNIISKIDSLVSDCESLLNENGTVIIIETLGTDSNEPIAPSDNLKLFYSRLEEKHGFKPVVIETDYRFESVEKAARIMGFFFGGEEAESIKEKNMAFVKEFTGLWYR